MLLHLLQVYERLAPLWRLLSTFDKHTPIVRNRQLSVKGRRLFAGLHVHCHVEFAVSISAKYAVSGRNVGIVPAYGGANVTMMRHQVIGRVKTYPAKMRHQYIDPGVSRVGRGPVMILAAAIQIA